jgi:hypothetical protein
MDELSEIKFANGIRKALNEGARLDGDRGERIRERLRAARERALERRRTAREPALAWAQNSAATVLGAFGGTAGFALRLLLAAALLAVGLFAIHSGQQVQRAADVEELDAMLLTDDLPIDAYLDRGFEAWLRKVSAGER